MKKYVLGMVFDPSFEHLLLMKRKKNPYNGLLNGIGGKIDEGETPLESIQREFKEETEFESYNRLELMFTMQFENEEMHVYFIEVDKQVIKVKENHEGIYDWYEVNDSFFDCLNEELAGGGNLPYFIKFCIDTYNKEG